MDNENVKVVSDALTGSLESTQKVQAMSGTNLHEETVRAILADDKTPLVGESISSTAKTPTTTATRRTILEG